MSIMMSICLVSLLSGVYCHLADETEVHITIYAPSGFIQNRSEVFFNKDKPGRVYTDKMKYELNILQYGKQYYVFSRVPIQFKSLLNRDDPSLL